jgi:hypothetical protein
MSSCICILKSGARKGQRCFGKVKVGQLCARHANCANAKPMPSDTKFGKFHEVVFTMKFIRTDKKTKERSPSSATLERYIATSRVIPENINLLILFDGNYLGIERTSDVQYIGKKSFYFTCQSNLSPKEIAYMILKQSLTDGEYESNPGNGSFVYPTKDGMNELGLLGFESVIVDGQKFK